MANANPSRPVPALSPDPAAAKCSRAVALLEEAFELIHDVLNEPGWSDKIPASFPEEAAEPLRHAICFMRPAENFPECTTRSEMDAAVEAEDAPHH